MVTVTGHVPEPWHGHGLGLQGARPWVVSALGKRWVCPPGEPGLRAVSVGVDGGHTLLGAVTSQPGACFPSQAFSKGQVKPPRPF